MRRMMMAALLALAVGGTAGSALAEPAFEDEEITSVDDAAAVDDRKVQPPTRVYGWASDRPLDCGAYHYWDGADCIDARDIPPDIGPKD